MPSFSVNTTDPTEIITREMASRVRDNEHKTVGWSINIEDNAARIVDEGNKDQARHGEPLAVGDVLDIDPNGLAWYAISQSGTATVNVNPLKYTPIERRSV